MSRVHVRNVPESIPIERFREICRALGLRGDVYYAREPASGCFLGKAYLDCGSAAEAMAAAASLHRYELAGAVLEAEASEASGFYDVNGLFADGSAAMGRRDGLPSE